MELTIVVPTRNEADNIGPLVARLDAALGEARARILFVDDSDDHTPERIAHVAASSARTIGLLHREAGERAGGLGSAVLAGLRAAESKWAVVMDGDLQHPPELVPELVSAATSQDLDVVVASRYLGSGSASGLSSAFRTWVSRGATSVAKAVFPRRLRGCSDPMSGFFLVRLAGLDLDHLRPSGFKILLEVLARSPRLRLGEVSFTFQARHSGESKASWREGVLYARRLLSLRLASLFGAYSARLATVAGFAVVGLTGIVVNSVALWALVRLMNTPLLLAAVLATQVSTAWNFVLSDRLVFSRPKARGSWLRLVGFAVINNAVLLARLPLLAWLVHSVGVGYLVANVATLVAAFAARFVVSDRYLFAAGESMSSMPTCDVEFDAEWEDEALPAASGRRTGPVDLVVDLREGDGPPVRRLSNEMPWRYDIHGIVTIGSAVRLRELDFFSATFPGPFDIEIHPARFGSGRARGRARVTQYAAMPAVSYEEHLGRFGSDFHVDMADNVEVLVGPMLVRSPHVLYTNVVEALLRFVLVSRGFILLHSACLSIDGHGVLLSALTDTGKTGTVLRLLRENQAEFLSDDMTILDADGAALCYPKPLTISQHTLRAVNAGYLTAKEWRRLRVQSRLHSKEGRGIGARLGEMNVPIMSLNAVTQYLVPPPKYVVERLVPCSRANMTQVEQLFVIERDEFRLTEIDPDGLTDELIANTDDAYGFPPFRYFAPALVVGNAGYEELRVRERAILADAMCGIRARRVATPDFSWADHIPSLLNDGNPLPDRGALALVPPSRSDSSPS